jgi:5,6,7,8-tetrahydromethanopterin hydro-lyase
MAKINRVLVGESLVGDGNEVAHIDLVIGPRGSAAETAFVNALANNKDGFTTLLAVIAPNLPCKPNTIMFNKVTIKDARQAVQMFGPAQYGVAKAVQDSVAEGVIPANEADDVFVLVGVFIHWEAADDAKDPGLQLPRSQGGHRSRRRRQADGCRGYRSAQLGLASVRCEDLKRKPSTAGK